MLLSEEQVVSALFARLGSREAEQGIHFRADYCRMWPLSTLEALVSARLLRRTTDADWVVCRKCEQRCMRPVEVGRTGNAIIICEQRDGVSSLPVARERLHRWKSSREAVAAFIGSSLATRIHKTDFGSGRVEFRRARLGKSRVSLSLEFIENDTILRLGRDRRISLEDVIIWKDGKPQLDLDELARIAQGLGTHSHSYQPTAAGRQQQVRRHQERNDGWQRSADALRRKHPGMSKDDISKTIFKSAKWPGVTSYTTVARVIRVRK